MAWQFRREGSTQDIANLTYEQIVAGLRDGKLETTDEVCAMGDADWQSIENRAEFAEVALEVEPAMPTIHDDPTTLDMNPLIDVCLVLLVFFILTTSYAVAVLKVIPLEGKTETRGGVRVLKSADVKRKIRVEASLNAQGALAIRIENQARDVVDAKGLLDPAKLEAALREFTRGADRKTDVLLDARGIDWGTAIAIQDAAKAAGVRAIDHVLR